MRKKKNGYGHPPSSWVELEGPLMSGNQILEIRCSLRYRSDNETVASYSSEFAHRAFRDVAPEAASIGSLRSMLASVGDSFEKAFHLASHFFTFLPGDEPTTHSMIANWRYGFPISSGADHQMQNYSDRVFPKYFGSR